jgi:hypothetical protein
MWREEDADIIGNVGTESHTVVLVHVHLVTTSPYCELDRRVFSQTEFGWRIFFIVLYLLSD